MCKTTSHLFTNMGFGLEINLSVQLRQSLRRRELRHALTVEYVSQSNRPCRSLNICPELSEYFVNLINWDHLTLQSVFPEEDGKILLISVEVVVSPCNCISPLCDSIFLCILQDLRGQQQSKIYELKTNLNIRYFLEIESRTMITEKE